MTTWLARAVELALDNAAAGQLPFGAVVVRNGADPVNRRPPAADWNLLAKIASHG